ncbi:MAG TPA: hypothetical protein VFE00_11665 [Arthrobacter sp.]|nr:hypothetical protein [Arthrobacter sp.]
MTEQPPPFGEAPSARTAVGVSDMPSASGSGEAGTGNVYRARFPGALAAPPERTLLDMLQDTAARWLGNPVRPWSGPARPAARPG